TMVAGKPIKQISNWGDKVIRVEKAAGAPKTLKASGLARGEATITLIAEDGTIEIHQVVVRCLKEPRDFLLLAVGEKSTLSSTPQKADDKLRFPRISKVVIDAEGIVSAEAVLNDASKVMLMAQGPGICWVEITDESRETTRHLVVVREKK